MNNFQFCEFLSSLTTQEEISYFLQLYRESGHQETNNNAAEDILREAFQNEFSETLK